MKIKIKAFVILITVSLTSLGQTINKTIFGQNAWVPSHGTVFNGVSQVPIGGLLNNHIINGDIQNSGVTVLRYGGTEFNNNKQDEDDIIDNIVFPGTRLYYK